MFQTKYHLSCLAPLLPLFCHKVSTVSEAASSNETSGQLFFPSCSGKSLAVCHSRELPGKTDVLGASHSLTCSKPSNKKLVTVL